MKLPCTQAHRQATIIQAVNGNDGTTIDCDGPGQGKGKGQQVACVAKQIKTYATNGQGNGVENSTQTGSRETLFNYDGYRLLGEYDISGYPVQETVWLGSLPVATIQNGNTYYLHTDHLGTPRVITDSDNTEVWKWGSDPFGTAVADEDPDGDGVHFSYNLRFPGQYFDEETGKHYNTFRDYDSATGRYVESDPIGLLGGFNTYAYVGGQPTTLSDPEGLCPLGGAICIGLPVGLGLGWGMLTTWWQQQNNSNPPYGIGGDFPSGGTGDYCSNNPEDPVCMQDEYVPCENNRPNDPVEPVWRAELIEENGIYYTRGPGGEVMRAKGNYDFVVMNNRIYVGPHHSGHHNISYGARTVDYAGTLHFPRGVTTRGQLSSWSNESGHYRPSPSNARQATLPLEKFEPWRPFW